MADTPAVAWVRPPDPIGGLDHLGVQAPCIALYAQLLPGITNVTDRARYFSFHPWVIRSFETRYKDHSLDEFRRVLRRAECLFALVAIRHVRQLADADEGRHGLSMVGRDKLMRIPPDAPDIVLDDYARQDAPHRYFKNRSGGLGQYYFGPLRDLRILDHSPGGPGLPPGYDRERGARLADAFGAGVPGDAFFRVLEAHSLKWTDLDELAPFCPCGLVGNAVEHSLLLDLFLARSDAFKSEGWQARQASIRLMLDLAQKDASDPDFEGLLRRASYSGTLSNGSPWETDGPLVQARLGWRTYQRNELLSVALQGLFAAVLRATERDRAGRLRDASESADVASELVSPLLGPKFAMPLADLIAEVRGGLPAIGNWGNAEHEMARATRLLALRLKDDELEKLAFESIMVLVCLLARGLDDDPYASFDIDPAYFDPREVHLLSLRVAAERDWSGLTVEQWIRWLAVHWGVNRHLRVALRKLRGERRDTFRIRPMEGELRVVVAPEPTYTVPRVRRAVQILRDIGLFELNDKKACVLTELGQRELEAGHGN